MLDQQGKVAFKPGPTLNKKLLKELTEGLEPGEKSITDGYDIFFINYDGVNRGGTFPRIITELAKNNIVVLDESHKAAGRTSQRGTFIRGILHDAEKVMYPSATYSKRPNTMPLYFRTALGTTARNIGSAVNVKYTNNGGGVAALNFGTTAPGPARSLRYPGKMGRVAPGGVICYDFLRAVFGGEILFSARRDMSWWFTPES